MGGSVVRAGLLALVILLVGCSDSPTEPQESITVTHMVDARTEWVYVSLGESVTVVPVADPATSEAWDLGFSATAVRVNGGAGGPAGVEVACLCQNDVEAMTAEQILAMSATSEEADFESVTAADIPSSPAAWQTAPTNTAGVFSVHPWYKYNLDGQSHQISPTFQVYLVRKGDEVYKLQITSYYNAAGDARFVSFRYARIAG